MLQLPSSLKIKRAYGAEEKLLEYTKKWLEQEERDPRIHVSDLLNPRLAYWKRKKPKKLSDRLAVMFLVGKVLHAFVLSAVEGAKGTDWATDTGSEYSKELDLVYSMDAYKKGIPRELKTSRSYYEPRNKKDLQTYCEQVICYAMAKEARKAQLWVLYLNLKDEEGRTSPSFRCYTLEWDEKWHQDFKRQMIVTRTVLQRAIKKNNPSELPLCQQYICGKQCEWFGDCKPPMRFKYGPDKRNWKDKPSDLLIQITRANGR